MRHALRPDIKTHTSHEHTPMKIRHLAIASLIACATPQMGSADPPPTHQDFRPQTFTTPSPLTEFYGGGDYRRGSIYLVVPSYGNYGYGYGNYSPNYYNNSGLGTYGASPFDGLDASRALYSRPVRNLVYPPGLPTQRIGFYETTIPYGDYRLRQRIRAR